MVKHSKVNELALCNTVAKKNPLEFGATESDVTCKKCLKILAKQKEDKDVVEGAVEVPPADNNGLAVDEPPVVEETPDLSELDGLGEEEVDPDPPSNPKWTLKSD